MYIFIKNFFDTSFYIKIYFSAHAKIFFRRNKICKKKIYIYNIYDSKHEVNHKIRKK